MSKFIVALVNLVFLLGLAAEATAQIVPGAVIPLDISKTSDTQAIAQKVDKCLAEETLWSLLGLAPNATMKLSVGAYADGNQVGDRSAWTQASIWYGKAQLSMNFDEWVTPTTSAKRYVRFSARTYYSYTSNDFQRIDVSVQTNAHDDNVNVDLEIDAALPHYAITTAGGEVCSGNNWGRESCKALEERVTAASLVIPNGFVNSIYWTNQYTGLQTQKQFDAYRYAECLQAAW